MHYRQTLQDDPTVLRAATFDDILRRAPAHGTPADPLGARLVSLMFARPSSPVWRDLQHNRAFLDARSGDAWDLFFVGMSAYGKVEDTAVPLLDPSWHHHYERYMNPVAFQEIEQRVTREHGAALKAADRSDEPWRYSGETDLVSFMCYGREPDWLSLRSVRLEDGSTGQFVSLGRIAEELGEWRWRGDAFDSFFVPGAGPRRVGSISLVAALAWSAAAVAGGVLGNSAYDLVKLAFKR